MQRNHSLHDERKLLGLGMSADGGQLSCSTNIETSTRYIKPEICQLRLTIPSSSSSSSQVNTNNSQLSTFNQPPLSNRQNGQFLLPFNHLDIPRNRKHITNTPYSHTALPRNPHNPHRRRRRCGCREPRRH